MFYWKYGRYVVSYDEGNGCFYCPPFDVLSLKQAAQIALADALFGSLAGTADDGYLEGVSNINRTKTALLSRFKESKGYSWLAEAIPTIENGNVRHHCQSITADEFHQREEELGDDTITKAEFRDWCDKAASDTHINALLCLDWYRSRYREDAETGKSVFRHLLYRPGWVLRPEAAIPDISVLTVEQTGVMYQQPDHLPAFVPGPEGITFSGALSNSKTNFFNGKKYAPVAINGDINEGTAQISIQKGTYFDYLDTCEYLNYETTVSRSRVNGIPDITEQTMPRRWAIQDIFDFSNRFAAIGINTATILYHVKDGKNPDGGTYFLLHRRGSNVSTSANSYSVIPAGYYEWTDFGGDLYPVDTVRREYGEELMGETELEDLQEPTVVEEIMTESLPVRYLGVGLDPSNLHTEMMALVQLDLNTPVGRYYAGNLTDAKQIDAYFDANSNYEGDVELVPFTLARLRNRLLRTNMAPVCREILEILLEHFDELKEI